MDLFARLKAREARVELRGIAFHEFQAANWVICAGLIWLNDRTASSGFAARNRYDSRPMQFLMTGKMTPASAEALKRHGHTTHEVAELLLAENPSAGELLKAAKAKQWDIITADQGLALAAYELDFWFDRSIVFLQLAGEDVEQDDAIDRLFARYKRLVPKQLYTVTETRVKVRQLPGHH